MGRPTWIMFPAAGNLAEAKVSTAPAVSGRSLSLAGLMRGEGLEPRRAADLVLQLAKFLAHRHAQGLIHGSLSPGAVLLAGGAPGVSCEIRRGTRPPPWELTPSVGGLSPEYASPERIRGASLDERTDVYGLGLTLFALIEGRPPFSGRSPQATLDLHLFRRPPLLDPESCPSAVLREALDQVIGQCLEKRPSRRFQNMEELVGALDGCLVNRRRRTSSRQRLGFAPVGRVDRSRAEPRAIAARLFGEARTWMRRSCRTPESNDD